MLEDPYDSDGCEAFRLQFLGMLSQQNQRRFNLVHRRWSKCYFYRSVFMIHNSLRRKPGHGRPGENKKNQRRTGLAVPPFLALDFFPCSSSSPSSARRCPRPFFENHPTIVHKRLRGLDNATTDRQTDWDSHPCVLSHAQWGNICFCVYVLASAPVHNCLGTLLAAGLERPAV